MLTHLRILPATGCSSPQWHKSTPKGTTGARARSAASFWASSGPGSTLRVLENGASQAGHAPLQQQPRWVVPGSSSDLGLSSKDTGVTWRVGVGAHGPAAAGAGQQQRWGPTLPRSASS